MSSDDDPQQFFPPTCGWWIRDGLRNEEAKKAARSPHEKLIIAIVRENTPEEDAEDLADPPCGKCECCIMDRLDPECQVLNIEDAVGPTKAKS